MFLWLPLTASAQAPLQAPRLRLAGPAGQTVIVVTRYYQAEQASKTVGSRFELGSAVQDIPLEEGSEGVRCFLIVPTNGQLVAALYDGQTLLSRATSAQPQVLQLLGGAVPEDSFRPPRALLDEREKRLAAQFFAALKPAASTRELVSNLPVANIDWQSLDAYSQTLQAELGTLRESALQLDGWLSWDGTLGARAISGLAEFEHGSCRFTLMEVDGKLVDVLVHSESMPPDWFHGPADSQAFQERSESLVRDLFSGQVAAAHSQFSPKYQAQVTRQTLAELSDGLNERFSAEVVGVELKKTWLGLYDSESRSKTFHVLHAISLADGKRLVSTVDFMFPCGP
ncbi:MAG: hypothetical protein KDA45_07640, partial [Planctomycetales bacterium]|nr:hypothetical protein [Planctomycetales bacterium]